MRIQPKRRRPRYPDLATYLARSGESQTDLARAVGASQAQISRLAAGLALPRADLADRLVRYCRIPLESFNRRYLRVRRYLTSGADAVL